jgi:hypothetical protein
MATKRRRKLPRLINQPMPAWAARLVDEAIAPGPDDEEARDAFFGWMFCDERVPGLPQSDTPEGNAIWLRASDAMWARTVDARKPAEKLGRAKAVSKRAPAQARSPVASRHRSS